MDAKGSDPREGPLALTPACSGEASRFQEAWEHSGPRLGIRAVCLQEGRLGGENV